MAVSVTEASFAPKDQSFTISCMEDAAFSGYVEISKTKDFADFVGNPRYGFISTDLATNKFLYNHLVLVDPNYAGPGDIIYWRIRNYSTDQVREAKSIRLKRPRSHQSGWNFVTGGSAADISGSTTGLNENCKQFTIPTLLRLNPDFVCIPGDIVNAQAAPGSLDASLETFQEVRKDMESCGLDMPIFHSPGDEDQEGHTRNREARGLLFPSSGVIFKQSQVIRGPQNDPFLEDGNSFNSYYAFGYGNAFFVFFNEYLGGNFATDINAAAYASQKLFIETVLKEHRNKYKWCFMFSHTSVDEVDPTNSGGAVNTIAETTTTRDWLMNLHVNYKVNAHFSGHYHGWRVYKHENGTTYVNSTLGSVATVNAPDWHNQSAFANIKIGIDENGNVNEDTCKIDIINSGVTGTQGDILNTEPDNLGILEFINGPVPNHLDHDVSLFDSSQRQVLLNFGSNWLYNATSTLSSPIDFVLTKNFKSSEFKPNAWNVMLTDADKLLSWKYGKTPIYGGIIQSELDTDSAFKNSNLLNSDTYTTLRLPFFWNEGTELSVLLPSANTPVYLLNTFDVSESININELQLNYQINDAAYIWINDQLAWCNDGEGAPNSTPPFTHSSRPELNPNKVDSTSPDFASNVISDLEPIPNSKDGLINYDNSHTREPGLHYELQGQPIRITNVDIIRNLKKTGNIVAVLLLQGRDPGEPSPGSSDTLAFDLQIVAYGNVKNKLYSPHIKSPSEFNQYNLGYVTIEWDINNPPYGVNSNSEDPYNINSVDTTSITYEIEYTLNYIGQATNWMTLKRRLSFSDSSYVWNVGKMIKSDSVRIRMRAKNIETQEFSDWSISDEFSINVFELLAPSIVSPVSNNVYSNYVTIILDETLTKNTFHQKVRYTLEYSSRKQNITWTEIIKNIPFSQNIVRWNIEDIPQSDDYAIRLTAKNFSTCKESPLSEPDQIARRYIYNIKIQQSGMFIIDTKPPQSIIEVNNNSGITNQLEQIINVFAEDETTQVETMQFRECDANSILSLGDLNDPYDPTGGCSTVEQLLQGNPDFNNLIGKSVNYSSKIQWVFEDKSGLRKLEALLTDSGGNMSIQESIRVFLNTYSETERISDFIIVIEQRDNVEIDDQTNPPTVTVVPSIFEVIYLGTESGNMFVLEPFYRLLYSVENTSISKLIEFNDAVYFGTYAEESDVGKIYRHDVSEPTRIHEFSSDLSEVLAFKVFNNALYTGLKNGELWKYNGFVFSKITTFENPISALNSDESYLYIAFQNSENVVLYNGVEFTSLEIT